MAIILVVLGKRVVSDRLGVCVGRVSERDGRDNGFGNKAARLHPSLAREYHGAEPGEDHAH